MSQFIETNVKSFEASAAVPIYARVAVGAGGKVSTASATVRGVGTAQQDVFADGDRLGVRLFSATGTQKMIASAAITAGANVFAAASGKVASSGTVPVGIALEAATADNDVIEVMHSNTMLDGVVGVAQVLRTRVTTAQVNAGHTLLAALPGLKYRLHDMAMIAVGGNAATATSVDILGTQSTSSVKLMDGRVAGLTQSTLLRAGTTTNGLILADGASFVACDANTAITINHTGSDLATATHIDVLLTYTVEV